MIVLFRYQGNTANGSYSIVAKRSEWWGKVLFCGLILSDYFHKCGHIILEHICGNYESLVYILICSVFPENIYWTLITRWTFKIHRNIRVFRELPLDSDFTLFTDLNDTIWLKFYQNSERKQHEILALIFILHWCEVCGMCDAHKGISLWIQIW